jgi:SAM-dependent methyltransferase
MRPSVRAFAQDVVENLPIQDPVVEIGSRPAEGQESETDVRSLFAGHSFTGCDIQAGPGVDRIEDIHRLSFEDNSVGTFVAFDTLEHVEDPLRALQEVHRVLKPGGVVAISSVMFFVIHAHPWDFWRFTPEGFSLLLRPFESNLVVAQGWDLMPESVFGVGVKGPAQLDRKLLPRTSEICDAWGRGRSVDFGPIRLSVRELWGHTLRETRAGVRRRLGRRS